MQREPDSKCGRSVEVTDTNLKSGPHDPPLLGQDRQDSLGTTPVAVMPTIVVSNSKTNTSLQQTAM
jgi:hypothetical protein